MKVRCAVCDKKGGIEKLYKFEALLKNLGYVGDKAHPTCIVEARKKINKKRKRASLPPIGVF